MTLIKSLDKKLAIEFTITSSPSAIALPEPRCDRPHFIDSNYFRG
ncbi:hypothetical protein QUA89_10520 [Microcoleus sp. F10-B4]